MKVARIYSALYQDFAHLHTFFRVPGEAVAHPEELIEPNSILVLHGGADISPSIYNQPVSKYTHATATPSIRDEREVALAKRAIKMGIPIFGICRGAQLSCALAGGTLVQHTNGHGHGTHRLQTADGSEVVANSCHHQMLNLQGTEHELLAWTKQPLSPFYINGKDEEIEIDREPEVVLFPTIKALAVQGHPEWLGYKDEMVQYVLKQLSEKIVNVLP